MVRGFKKNRLGANDHLLAFGGGEPEAVKLKNAWTAWTAACGLRRVWTWRVDCGAQFGVPALEAKAQAVAQQEEWDEWVEWVGAK